MQVTANTGFGKIVSSGVVGDIRGRTGYINSTDKVQLGRTEILTVTSVGRDDPTTAEAKRAAVVLRILQGDKELLGESPWIQNIWFNNDSEVAFSWPEIWSQTIEPKTPKTPTVRPFQLPRVLNSSQQRAVNAMISQQDKYRITIIQGPPGTGKTSVISSFVQLSVKVYNRTGIWLIAQSNVAVKNIAEKLINDNFEEWKLLVSKDFKHDW